jgi:hypothetical protein
MPTSAQLLANRQNAQRSTGPRTAPGKAAVARNACRHGLSGAFTILAHEDHDEFQSLLDKYRSELKPESADETFLVETMAQSRWSLARARRIEAHLLDQIAGQPVQNDPNAYIAAELAAKSNSTLATVQRYATTAERSYFRARRELLQARSRELRDKANQAQIWLKSEVQNTSYSPMPGCNPPDPSIFSPSPLPSTSFPPQAPLFHRE